MRPSGWSTYFAGRATGSCSGRIGGVARRPGDLLILSLDQPLDAHPPPARAAALACGRVRAKITSAWIIAGVRRLATRLYVITTHSAPWYGTIPGGSGESAERT